MSDQQPGIDWREGVPVSRRFGDPYYSLENGLEETRHVFLGGNGLPARLRPGFRVAELGVGTGLNLLALAALVRETGRGPIRYTGFEAFPMARGDIEAALARFPGLGPEAEALLDNWGGETLLDLPHINARMIVGDARETVPAWDECADAWFLDGFAPAKNPELWEPGLLAAVARKTAPGGTAATYSAAGHVRRSLAAAGFEVTRVPGYGRKRHMTQASLP